MERVKNYLNNFINLFKKPEMRILPGQLAFFFVLSIIPIVALLGILASKMGVSLDNIEASFNIAIPNGVALFIKEIVNHESISFNLTVFLISAFILASNGMHSIIIASNTIYKIKPRNVIKRRGKAILMTFILVEIIFFLLVIPVFGDTIFAALNEHFANNVIVILLSKIYYLLKYPICIIIIYLNIKSIYTIAPDAKIEPVSARKGALFTTISWLLTSELYSYYLNNFTSYDIFYGSISNIIILLLWVYMLAYIFVLGLIINAGSYNEEEVKSDI